MDTVATLPIQFLPAMYHQQATPSGIPKLTTQLKMGKSIQHKPYIYE